MLRSLLFLAVVVNGVLIAPEASASDFKIQIEAKAGNRKVQSARTEEAPSTEKKAPSTTKVASRPILELTRDETLQVSWHAENVSKSNAFPDVLMHCFVAEEKQTGQAEVPKLGEDVTFEGALTMDFKPRDKADWRMTFKIREPGRYVLRVETRGLLKQHGHEHFAALDLIVK